MEAIEKGDQLQGPWRATRLWNSIIRTFRAEMPLKKHKKNMRTYENCFSSTEAVDFLHRNLQKNPNFGPDVTKDQTIQLLKKLYRAGIIENVKEDSTDEEFKVSGELYRFSDKSPAKHLRTPGKGERRPLAEMGNVGGEEKAVVVREVRPREPSKSKKAREEMKKQLNLSYFQALPSNSLIILDNDDTWRRVFVRQLSSALSSDHVARLDFCGQLDMGNVMHNMTRVSAKGIVQVDDKLVDLPHWVLSAMKCLANWPKQMRTANGKESGLPNYAGFENDVFNVVKDYFLGLSGPLTTYPLYEFLIGAFIKAEALASRRPVTRRVMDPPHQLSVFPCCQSQTLPNRNTTAADGHSQQAAVQFYEMADDGRSTEEFLGLLSSQERVARIKQTFEVLAPLATSSVQNTYSSSSGGGNSTFFSSGHSTLDTVSPPSLSPDMSATAIMKNFLPPNTCFETAFMQESPITRIVPQKEHEVLHFRRSYSGRSLTHIPSGGWTTKSTSTQTEEKQQQPDVAAAATTNSLKRLPRWKRTRLRKSIAVMETNHGRVGTGSTDAGLVPHNSAGIVNPSFSFTNSRSTAMAAEHTVASQMVKGKIFKQEENEIVGVVVAGRSRQLYSSSDLPDPCYSASVPIRGCSSVDNLLDREHKLEKDFLLKYRQVSGDLRSSCDLVELARKQEAEVRDKSFIESKALRKEKRKKRWRNMSADRLVDERVAASWGHNRGAVQVGGAADMDEYTCRLAMHCYVNPGLESSPPVIPVDKENQAPLADQEICDLSPVPRAGVFNRHSKYNNSYRLATNQPATPVQRLGHLPRTSTQICLNPGQDNSRQQQTTKHHLLRAPHPTDIPAQETDDCLYVRAEPYLCNNSEASRFSGTTASDMRGEGIGEALYTRPGQLLPLQRYTVSGILGGQPPLPSVRPVDALRRHSANRLSRSSQATIDSGRYSDLSKFSKASCYGPARSIPPPAIVVADAPDQHVNLDNQLVAVNAEDKAVEMFRLLSLLLPPENRRKLQLLLKFIRKVSLNDELKLDPDVSNRVVTLETFTGVVLRPADLHAYDPEISRRIVELCLDKYEEIWVPPQSLRREVEEKVYQSLVNRRLEAGEDPYPVTYCKQVTKQEYEASKLTGAETALLDLLEALLQDNRMTEKEKKKKLHKFKDAYPALWRKKFPDDSVEPDLNLTKKERSAGKFSSLSRIRHAMGM